MKIIESIEIKHFRSFIGSPKKFSAILESTRDLNIISGSNDSGKSNILRALSIFFNNEISYGIPLDFERDFYISNKESGVKVIEISISFDLSKDNKRDKFLPEKFRISKYYDRNGFRNYLYRFYLKEKNIEIRIDSRQENNKNIYRNFLPKNPTKEEIVRAEKREWNYRVKFSGFLNKSTSFEYVPAIRDKSFFAQLFGRVISRIKSNEDQRIEKLNTEKNKIQNWEKTIKNKTEKTEFKENIQHAIWRAKRLEDISREIVIESKFTKAIADLEEEINKYSSNLTDSLNFLQAEFKIGKNLREFFEGIDVGTGQKKDISLKLRGDGIQAKFVPKILDFLSKIDHEKKYFIWGFEEPENSAEYHNQQEFAESLKSDLIQTKQIFLTTHSEEFLQLYDGVEILEKDKKINLYHIKKYDDPIFGQHSKISLFDPNKGEFDFANQKTRLEEDLGHSHLRAKYSKELKQKEDNFLHEKATLIQENSNLKSSISINSKPIVFVEDKYDNLYKIIFLKIMNVPCSKFDFSRQFDKHCPFDIYSTEGAEKLEGFLRQSNIKYWQDKKIIGIFDFDQTGLEKFKNLKNQTYWKKGPFGMKQTGIYKQRNDHNHFYSCLLPIPKRLESLADLEYPSYIEIENLFQISFLTKNHLVKEKTTTGNTKYYEVISKKKSTIWEKTFTLSNADLEDFIPLFEIIIRLLDINYQIPK